MFDPVDPRQSFPKLEEGILQYWRREDLFRRSIKNRSHGETFSFYDGPPFATGLPHYGHLLAGTIKDVIPRFQTMRGKRVERRFGWDCHGLPIENLIEKEHHIQTKRDIEAMGVSVFNEHCRGSVQRFVREWRTTVERMGRWVDVDFDYRTMDPDYMESIWWVFSQLYSKGLIYEGHKPMHICPRCATPLSNFEVTQGYKEIQDYSVTAMFALEEHQSTKKPKEQTFLLAWTTTPWTLPGNLFLAVHPDTQYYRFKLPDDAKEAWYIASEDYVRSRPESEIEADWSHPIPGHSLVGKHYTPLFPYFAERYKKKAFTVVAGDFVTTSEGTGIVHIAPGYGEDDFQVGLREGVEILQHVSIEGRFTKDVVDFADQEVKPKDDHQSADKAIARWLKEHGLLFKAETYSHSYPHCWRCDSPLLNYATGSWFVAVEKIKEDMLQTNAETEWVPAHMRDGRFGNWLENARDWAISRNRYWGTPIPVWRGSASGTIDVIERRDDLLARQQMRFTKITAVRHGEAEHNVGHFYQSAIPGVDLTPRGKEQAGKAGEFLAQGTPVTRIYCSPLARTRQTAQAIADATGAEIVVDERLREVDVGTYERTAIDLSDQALTALKREKKLQENAPESIFHLEGMERWDSIYGRVSSFLQEILPKHRSEHIVIVTHADPVITLRHFFTKEDPFKLSHQPAPVFATPESYFWDHDHDASMDLHCHRIDSVTWADTEGEAQSIALTCVRHGETDWNRENKVQGGNVDIPLNETGKAQVRTLAASLNKEQFDLIVCSDLKRATETAAILGEALGIPVAEPMPALRERDIGTWSGRPIEDVLKESAPLPEGGNIAFHYATPPNGESLSAFLKRIHSAQQQLLTSYPGKRILLVAHRGTIQACMTLTENLTYAEAARSGINNATSISTTLYPAFKRVPEVLDCWFESGSMPYAKQRHPFAFGQNAADAPANFPADFIAEGVDQTRGWFYTLTVLAAALFGKPAFRHCIVNGIILAEDGKKMSKRLQNYPEPTQVIDEYGADALRFALMSSPAVRAEDIRFSKQIIEETLRTVLLPLWNSYSFFITYANLAGFTPVTVAQSSTHPLDQWILAETQDLVNRMTTQLEAYDLSATCQEIHETIDALTNWYIRLSRRRFAGKGISSEDQHQALTTLYEVLTTIAQLIAPFCPFMSEAMYLNLISEEHGSIHLTDWPLPRPLSKEEQALIAKNRFLRTVTSLCMHLRMEHGIKVRTPLEQATVAYPLEMLPEELREEEIDLLKQEVNVKKFTFSHDPGSLGEQIAMVDARKVGPRLGARVQEIIQAGKRGEFTREEDDSITILDERLSPDEVKIIYRGKEGEDIAADRGIVVSLDTTLTEDLLLEGLARELIRAIQQLRKQQGYEMGEKVSIGLGKEADAVLARFQTLIEEETATHIGDPNGQKHVLSIEELKIEVFLNSKGSS